MKIEITEPCPRLRDRAWEMKIIFHQGPVEENPSFVTLMRTLSPPGQIDYLVALLARERGYKLEEK